MYSTVDFRKNLKIEIDGEPYIIVEFQHVKPGKGVAFVKTRIKSLITGNVLDRTFRSGDKVDRPDIEEREMQYLYSEGTQYIFMDNSSYDQVEIGQEILGDNAHYLQENLDVSVLLYNSRPIGVELPIFVELEIEETEPGVRGDTASGGSKPATLSTGGVVQVPLFIDKGDMIKVDTRTGRYVEKVNKG